MQSEWKETVTILFHALRTKRILTLIKTFHTFFFPMLKMDQSLKIQLRDYYVCMSILQSINKTFIKQATSVWKKFNFPWRIHRKSCMFKMYFLFISTQKLIWPISFSGRRISESICLVILYFFNFLNFSNKEIYLTQPELEMDKDFWYSCETFCFFQSWRNTAIEPSATSASVMKNQV